MHRDEKRKPGNGNERGEGDGEGVLAGLFCAFVCFISSPLFLVFLSLFLLFFFLMFCPCSSLLQFVFHCSLSLILVSLCSILFSPVSVSCSSSLPLSFPSLAVFFFFFLCHSPLVSPPGFPPRSFSLPLLAVSPLPYSALFFFLSAFFFPVFRSSPTLGFLSSLHCPLSVSPPPPVLPPSSSFYSQRKQTFSGNKVTAGVHGGVRHAP